MATTAPTTLPATRLEETPVAGPAYLWTIFPALMGRNARVWVYFRVGLIMDLVNMAAQASIFFFVGQALGSVETWTGNYAAFLAVGLVFTTLLEASLTGPSTSLGENYWMARLETVLLSPCPVPALLVADSFWFYVRALINAAILGTVGWWFGARLDAGPGDALLAGAGLLLAAVAVLGFGLISAAMFMLINAKGFNDPVGWLVMVLQGLVTGAYFPVDQLPGILQVMAECLPQTYAIDVARRLLLPDTETAPLITIGGLSPLASDFLLLALFLVVLPALGWLTFRSGLHKAQRDGGLSRWA
jgi:ABC-type polysaccharide/polyol phosphate export permease